MKNERNSVPRRVGRRLLVAVALGAAVFLGTAASASAATTATFSSGVLTVFGDSADNSIVDQPRRGRQDPRERRRDRRHRRHADRGQHHR